MEDTVKDACLPDCEPAAPACKLTTAEFKKHKATIIKSLKEKVTEKKELENGYAFCFPGSDKMLDRLVEFIKAERKCCEFFSFNLLLSNDTKDIWLELKGPAGAKNFIVTELEF